MDSFIDSFVSLVQFVTPYALVWRIGLYIVSVLLSCICGGGKQSGKIDI